ncbi:MAG: hypothetical protein VXZ38_03770, partial [Planctomycetota bacterium]|nr:hypothetical protein [Planctomycetota bacterium]
MIKFRLHCSAPIFVLGLILFQLLQVHGDRSAVAQEKDVDTPQGIAVGSETDKRSTVLADPTDFSQPPTLPQLAQLDTERLESA